MTDFHGDCSETEDQKSIIKPELIQPQIYRNEDDYEKTGYWHAAHVDAGKTTLSESILYTSGAIRKLGRVDNKMHFLIIMTMSVREE